MDSLLRVGNRSPEDHATIFQRIRGCDLGNGIRMEATRRSPDSADLTRRRKNPKLGRDRTGRTGFSARKESAQVATKLSARNKIEGKIVELEVDGVMAHVAVRVGKNTIESVITRRSAEEMKLKVGDTVSAVIKSTEVMLQKG
jgi:molybdopterin-binding protein